MSSVLWVNISWHFCTVKSKRLEILCLTIKEYNGIMNDPDGQSTKNSFSKVVCIGFP